MYDFASDVKKVEAQIANSQQQMSKVGAALNRAAEAEGKIGEVGLNLDILNADLTQVKAQQDAMNGNIAELIAGLDKVTQEFGGHFDKMKQKTFTEKAIGFLSRTKADAMREQRIRSTEIDSKLNELISQSNIIIQILSGQLNVLTDQEAKTVASLEKVLDERITVVKELEAARQQLDAMDPQIIALEDKISMEQDPAQRTAMQAELQKMNEAHNALKNEVDVKLALSQTLENYVSKYQTFIASIQDQISTQRVLINKMKTDTTQRVVLYDALSQSLRTAQQQEVAHRINEIGTAVDNEATKTMAYIGSAANNRMAAMLESHEGTMVFNQEIMKQKATADERFMRRFGKVLEKHDLAKYGADNAE